MNEELKNKLTERFDSAYGEEVKIGLRDALRKVYLDGVEHGYQYALQHPQWIPVEEELPEENEEVLAYNAENEEVIACDYHHRMFHCWPEAFKESITHWMPLPEAPRKEE